VFEGRIRGNNTGIVVEACAAAVVFSHGDDWSSMMQFADCLDGG